VKKILYSPLVPGMETPNYKTCAVSSTLPDSALSVMLLDLPYYNQYVGRFLVFLELGVILLSEYGMVEKETFILLITESLIIIINFEVVIARKRRLI
jgi:hypothetical protein